MVRFNALKLAVDAYQCQLHPFSAHLANPPNFAARTDPARKSRENLSAKSVAAVGVVLGRHPGKYSVDFDQ